MVPLLNHRMHDGSRHFGELPQGVVWYAMRDHVERLPGAKLPGILCDDVTEVWIDFSYEGHAFTVNDPLGAYWLFVDDPACPEPLLQAVLEHFRQLTS